jgi:3-phosphoshikimate 1-carboxyvinyltransferase
MNAVEIQPRRQLDATVTIPGSKSCTARALVMAALTRGESTLVEPADCDDTDYLAEGLRGLGLAVEKHAAELVVHGKSFVPPTKPLFLGNSGTAMRFLCAACATLDGSASLDGVERMRQRPIADLLEALNCWGVETDAAQGCPPVTIRSRGTFGGETHVKGSASSQYLTGLLLVAPCAERDVTIRIDGELVSKPYVDLTIAMMAERGVHVENDTYKNFRVKAKQQYKQGNYPIEADASGASYFLAAAAIAGGRVRVKNLNFTSQQGDAQFARILEMMGCHIEGGQDYIEVSSGPKLHGIDIDLNAMPDMAQTLAVVAMFASSPTRIRNVQNLRIKETDRIKAVVTELRKLGAQADEFEDGMTITPGVYTGAAIDTYDDHRMAMSFALAGLCVPGVTIKDPNCVRKTFPDFFDRFAKLS